MAESPNLTIRLPEDLRERLKNAAAAVDQSPSEYSVRALRLRMAGACSTCGRDSGAHVVQAPGMTEAFDRWCRQQLEGRGESPMVVLATSESTGHRIYTGRFTAESIHDSFITIELARGVLMPVPRAHILMWEAGQSGQYLRERLRMFWNYVDVNMALNVRANR